MEGEGGIEYAIKLINWQAANMEPNVKNSEGVSEELVKNIKIREEMQPNLREKHVKKHIIEN